MSGMTPAPTSLTIAVLTYRRPGDLDAILPLLVDQAESVAPRVTARVLVVDNDPEASARERVAATAASAGVDVLYSHEPEPGIAVARNRALREAKGSELLVFIDDDERPSEAWLRSLTGLRQRTGARAVVGPVVSEFSVEPDPWIVAGGFFVRRRFATGTPVVVAATNNLLIDLDWVRSEGLEFDRAFGISGGEDTLFTRAIVARGGDMLWCAEAVVTDVVPPERLTRRWVTMRAFSSGNSWSTTALHSSTGHPGPRLILRARLTVHGAARVALGAGRLGAGVLSRSLVGRARGVRTVARGAGMVAGAFGYGYQEYRRAS